MKCSKCNNVSFCIDIKTDCSNCENNGAWTEKGYIYNQRKIDNQNLERNEAIEEGECAYGSTWDNGCYMFECTNCGKTTNLGMMV